MHTIQTVKGTTTLFYTQLTNTFILLANSDKFPAGTYLQNPHYNK